MRLTPHSCWHSDSSPTHAHTLSISLSLSLPLSLTHTKVHALLLCVCKWSPLTTPHHPHPIFCPATGHTLPSVLLCCSSSSPIMVVPPARAALEPWLKSSTVVVPRYGIWKWVWMSMPPGITIFPLASMVFTPPGTMRLSPICLWC